MLLKEFSCVSSGANGCLKKQKEQIVIMEKSLKKDDAYHIR
jgi:hypothetical protein